MLHAHRPGSQQPAARHIKWNSFKIKHNEWNPWSKMWSDGGIKWNLIKALLALPKEFARRTNTFPILPQRKLTALNVWAQSFACISLKSGVAIKCLSASTEWDGLDLLSSGFHFFFFVSFLLFLIVCGVFLSCGRPTIASHWTKTIEWRAYLFGDGMRRTHTPPGRNAFKKMKHDNEK